MRPQDDHDRAARHFPHGRELAAIVAFWMVFAVLSVTSWLFPPTGQGPPITIRFISIGLFESLLWVIATPPIFWLTSRFSVERGDKVKRIAIYLVIGVVVALALDLLVETVRTTFAPPPPRFSPGGQPRERPFWGFARIRFLNDYMLFLGVLAAGVARDYFARYHRRLEETAGLRAQLAEARLTVLQSQLNPHFLFNTLNAISALVDRDPRGVRRMIARLSELLRATLEPSTEPEIPLSREIALLERYLEILRIRFQGRLETTVDVPASVQAALVPPLILQPLVENSMKHAVGRTSEQSRIGIRAERSGETLILTVEDTGPGEGDGADIDGIIEPGAGIGLRNTRARLAQIYGDDHALDLDRVPNGGTIVTIRIPYHTSADLRAVPGADEALI